MFSGDELYGDDITSGPEGECGWDWNHTLEVIGESHGLRVYRCTECDREVHEI